MRRIILAAHEERVDVLVEWLQARRGDLEGMELFAAWSTAERIAGRTGLPVRRLGAHPGEAEAAACRMVGQRVVDLVVFLWNPESPGPHEVDANVLLGVARECDAPMALNPWTADHFLAALLGRKSWRRATLPLGRTA